jgi:hypothetical protein
VKRRAGAITNAAEDELLLADLALQHFLPRRRKLQHTLLPKSAGRCVRNSGARAAPGAGFRGIVEILRRNRISLLWKML